MGKFKQKALSAFLAAIIVSGSIFAFPISPIHVPEAFAANAGSVSLDRTAYPVPWGVPANYASSTETIPNGRSLFPIHQLGMGPPTSGLDLGEFLANGTTVAHVRVFDPDLNLNSTSIDNLTGYVNATSPGCAGPAMPYPNCIAAGIATVGNVKIILSRPGVGNVTLGYAGGSTNIYGLIDVNDDEPGIARQFGPVPEIAQNAGIFQLDLPILSTDGPSSTSCPVTLSYQNATGQFVNSELVRFDDSLPGSEYYCILSGDQLITEYTDLSDAASGVSLVSDVSNFDLRDVSIQTDKRVYDPGSPIILTLIEPDFDLNSKVAESYDLDLMGWTMNGFAGNGDVTLGDRGGNQLQFNTTGKVLQETGVSTGIFQATITMPDQINGTFLLPNQTVNIEFNDWGNSLSSYVGSSLLNGTVQIFASPLVVNDYFSTPVDTPLNNIPILDNDEGDGGITILNVTSPINGGVAVVNTTSNGINYTPASGFRGVDRFTYSGLDGFGNFANGDVEITVLGTNGKIAFHNLGSDEIYVMNSDGGSQTSITSGSSDTFPAYSSNSTKIAFSRNQDIYVMNSDGTGIQQLTSTPDIEDHPTWSSDGQRIAFTGIVSGVLAEINVMNQDGSGILNLSNNSDDDRDPAFSPDGTRIAFSSNRTGSYEIYVMNSDGSNQLQLTSFSSTSAGPTWSSDGKNIAFWSQTGPTTDILVMNSDGSNIHALTSNATFSDYNPYYSPDGTKLAFERNVGIREIFIMNSDGTGVTQATNFASSFAGAPNWGTIPDTSNTDPIANNDAFTTQAGLAINNLNVLANDTDTNLDPLTITSVGTTLNGGTTAINSTSNGINYSPPSGFRGVDVFNYTISDGNGGFASANVAMRVFGNNGKLAFASDRDGNWEIYTMNSDGTGQTRLTNNNATDQFSSWSPDGTKLAFQSDRDGNWEIYTMNSDGTGQVNISNNATNDNTPTWSPMGTKLAFESYRDGNWEIYTMNSDGTGQTRLTNNNATDQFSSWSPDGTKLTFASDRDGNWEIYTMNSDGTGQANLFNNVAFDNFPTWGTAPNTIFGGSVIFDQSSYIVDTSGYLTINDPSANLDSGTVDSIAVTLVTQSGSNLLLNIQETTVDSGLFVSNIIKFSSGPTSAPTEMHVEPIDEVQATYLTTTAIAQITLANGARAVPTAERSILFSPGSFQLENGATISVYDPSANLNNNAIDTTTAFVSSWSYPQGLQVTLQEDGPTSGIFVDPTLIPLTASTTNYETPKLHVTANDEIFVNYPTLGHPEFSFLTESGSTYNTFTVGLRTDIPFAGDWDGDGKDTVALFRPYNGYTFLRNTAGSAYLTLNPTTTGAQGGDVPIAGDWDGNGIDSVGYFRPSTKTFYLLNENGVLYRSLSAATTGAQGGDVPIAGDWDGNGIDSVGYFRSPIKTFYLLTESGSTYNTLTVGLPSDIPFAGDWDGDGKDTVALFRPYNGYTFLRNTAGSAYLTLNPTTTGAQGGDVPIAGDWDNDASHKDSFGYERPLDTTSNIASTTVFPIPSNQALTGTYSGPQDALVCDESNNVDGICQAWIQPSQGLAIEVVPGARWTQSCNINIPNDCPTSTSLDVYVEIDYMTGHRPSDTAINKVVQAFKNSGVSNGQGINLHVLIDEDIGRNDPVIRLSDVTPGNEPTFDQIKRAFFGTAAERAQGEDILAAKAQVYHYVLFANSLKETPTSSGYSEIGGNDVIVTMGAFTNGVGSVDEQAGTLMHELGHNLALRHGGGDDLNYKPNYISVMNYQFQFTPDQLSYRTLDYSRQSLTPLVEGSLSEQNGISIVNQDGTLTPATNKTGHVLQTIIGGFDAAGNILPAIPVPTGQNADLNRINGIQTSTISQNVHFFNKYDGRNTATTVLNGHDDWHNLDLNFRDSATFLSGDIHTDPAALNEAPANEITTPDPISAPDVDTQSPTAKPQRIIVMPSATNVPIILMGIDPNSDPLSFAISTPPTSGSLLPIVPINATSASITYNTGLARIDSFNFTVNDGVNTSVPANVTIIKNIAPTANSQSVSTRVNNPIILTLTGSDADGDQLQFTVPVGPLSGVLGPITQLGTSATIQYTPNQDFTGSDEIQFRVRDGFEPSQLATVSLNVLPPESSSTGSSTGTGMVSFDTDNGGISDLTAMDPNDPGLPAGKPAGVTFDHGLFSFDISGITPGSSANVTITYPSPIPGGSQYWKVYGGVWVNATSLVGDNDGDNVLILHLTDGGLGDADGIANGIISDPSGVGILASDTPVADDQAITFDEDTVDYTITLTASDPKGTGLAFTILSQQDTTKGTIVHDQGSDTVLYVPFADKNGQDSFTFVANDGSDDSNIATVTINITPINDVPVAPNVVDVTVQQDHDVTFTITATDVDTNDETNPDHLSFQIMTIPTKGSVLSISNVDANSAQFTYRPNTGITGEDSFEYHVTDRAGVSSNTGTVQIHIEPVVIPPTPSNLQEQKQDAINQLNSISTDNSRTQKLIQKAIKPLSKSVSDELWNDDGNTVDEKNGKKVFTEEAKAVNKLMKVLMKTASEDDHWNDDNDDPEFSDDSDPETPLETSTSVTSKIQSVINTLMGVDKKLADDAIAQANNHAATLGGKDKKKADKFLDDIAKSMQKAQQKIGDGKLHQGILQYKKAWQAAQSILKL